MTAILPLHFTNLGPSHADYYPTYHSTTARHKLASEERTTRAGPETFKIQMHTRAYAGPPPNIPIGMSDATSRHIFHEAKQTQPDSAPVIPDDLLSKAQYEKLQAESISNTPGSTTSVGPFAYQVAAPSPYPSRQLPVPVPIRADRHSWPPHGPPAWAQDPADYGRVHTYTSMQMSSRVSTGSYSRPSAIFEREFNEAWERKMAVGQHRRPPTPPSPSMAPGLYIEEDP